MWICPPKGLHLKADATIIHYRQFYAAIQYREKILRREASVPPGAILSEVGYSASVRAAPACRMQASNWAAERGGAGSGCSSPCSTNAS